MRRVRPARPARRLLALFWAATLVTTACADSGPLDDLLASVMQEHPHIKQMCHACFSGEYPTGDITAEMLLQIEQERMVHR